MLALQKETPFVEAHAGTACACQEEQKHQHVGVCLNQRFKNLGNLYRGPYSSLNHTTQGPVFKPFRDNHHVCKIPQVTWILDPPRPMFLLFSLTDLLHLLKPLASRVPKHEVYTVSALGIVIMVWDIPRGSNVVPFWL